MKTMTLILLLLSTTTSHSEMLNRNGRLVPNYNTEDPNLYNNGYGDGALPKTKAEYARDTKEFLCLQRVNHKESFLKDYNPFHKYTCKELEKYDWPISYSCASVIDVSL